MRILLIGERYSDNLGDQVLCQIVEHQLKHEFEDSEIVFLDISGRKENIQDTVKKELSLKNRFSFIKYKIIEFITHLGIDLEYFVFKSFFPSKKQFITIDSSHFDIAVFAGGQMIKNTFILQINYIVEQLEKNGVPVIFNSCGAGIITSKKLRRIISDVLNKENVYLISVRDSIDKIKELISENHSNNKVKDSFDPAIWCSDIYHITKRNSNTIGLGIMFSIAYPFRKQANFWKKTVCELEKRNLEWHFFCNGSKLDYSFAKYILSQLGYKEEKLANRPIMPEELIKTISGFKSIISFRLHSHIIAYSLKIPSIGVAWDKKLFAFFDKINRKKYCMDLTNNIKDILAQLNIAEKDEYDQELREYQKNHESDLLINAVKAGLGLSKYDGEKYYNES